MSLNGRINVGPRCDFRVSDWEFREAVDRMRHAMTLPRGERRAVIRGIAIDYGVSERTLYRWIRYTLHTIRVGKYEALFVIGSGTPSQVTHWEQAA